jgi:hypothetical protein
MNIERLLAHKAELRAQLNAELRFCRAKYRRWIADVDLQIYRLKRAPASNSRTSLRQLHPRANSGEQRSLPTSRDLGLLSLVRNLLADLDDQALTTRSLSQMVWEETGHRITSRRLGKPLSALARAGEIVVLKRGSGRQPTLYGRFQRRVGRRSFAGEISTTRQNPFESRTKRTGSSRA